MLKLIVSSPAPELDCWRKIQSGDVAAFSALFKKYYPVLYQFAGRYVKDAQTAENICQNVFVDLWTKREKLEITISLKSYLYQMIKNKALNFLNTEKRMSSLESGSPQSGNLTVYPEDQLEEKELKVLIDQAISRLPSQCRQIYLMKRYERLKYTEIAEILDISVNTVKTQMKRALSSLVRQLGDLDK
jgi:RNA polymerase sigma-70 factor (ECF subfamily)